MPLGTQIAAHLPYLRRYARALTGRAQTGDQLVAATLDAALADARLRDTLRSGGRIALYQAFTRQLAKAQPDGASHIATTQRQALLLTTLEEFGPAEAAAILAITPDALAAAVAAAHLAIAQDAPTRVLIIEDEPLIALQLEALVESRGHSVFGTAPTHAAATALLQQASPQAPGLVLADIQLADGSSGLAAAADVLSLADVPVIVITAFPERLLTGQPFEPAFLIAKPFREATICAAIAQALACHSARLPNPA